MRNYSSTAAETSLSSGITGLSTTMQVVSTSGFPVSTPYTLVIDPGKPEEEIVDVTAVGGLTLTITRAVDGTSATAHSVGAVVRHMATARDFRESQEHIAAGSNVHGVSGSVVGTTSAQSLSNKTLVSPTLSGTVSNTGTVSGGTVNPTTLQQGGVQAVTVSGLQTLTNKTLSSPIVSGTLSTSGDVTLAGSVVGGSLNPSTLQRGGVDAVVVTGAQTLSGKTLDNPTLLGAITTQSLSAYPLIVCTSTTRPASPVEGMTIYETDTDFLLAYDGTAWKWVGGKVPFTHVRFTADTSLPTGENVVGFDRVVEGSGWSTSTFRFTPTVAGIYAISFALVGAVSSIDFAIKIRKNGLVQSEVTHHTSSSTGYGKSLELTKFIRMNGTTDYIDLTAARTGTGGYAIEGGDPAAGTGGGISEAQFSYLGP